MVSTFEYACPHLLLSLTTAEANPVFGTSCIVARHLQTYSSCFRDRFEEGSKVNCLLNSRLVSALSLILLLSLLAVLAFEQKKGQTANEARHRSENAAMVFNAIMGAPDD